MQSQRRIRRRKICLFISKIYIFILITGCFQNKKINIYSTEYSFDLFHTDVIYTLFMTDIEQKSDRVSQQQPPEPKQEPSFYYQMTDMKARKIATLIKFSKLPYLLEQETDDEARPFLLRTSQGELQEEYQIINYIVNDSFCRGARSSVEEGEEKACLCVDIYSWAKMNEHLFQLRKTLFPMLQELYGCLLGHEKVKRSKYDSLSNKIRKQILKLDQKMGEHSEVYGIDFCFINIIIVCELFLACKLFFEEKFRKSKIRLFSKCEKIARSAEFQEQYGKVSFCLRQCLPVQFQEEDQPETNQEALQLELAKLVEPWVAPAGNDLRNELLYNFFRNNMKSQESKIPYFPYYWLMYQSLQCTLVQILYPPGQTLPELQKHLLLAIQELPKIIKSEIDYGFLGIYFNQKEKQHIIQGLVCLGDQSFQQFAEEIKRQPVLKNLSVVKIDVQDEIQRRKVQALWEYQAQGISSEGVIVQMLREF